MVTSSLDLLVMTRVMSRAGGGGSLAPRPFLPLMSSASFSRCFLNSAGVMLPASQATLLFLTDKFNVRASLSPCGSSAGAAPRAAAKKPIRLTLHKRRIADSPRENTHLVSQSPISPDDLILP